MDLMQMLKPASVEGPEKKVKPKKEQKPKEPKQKKETKQDTKQEATGKKYKYPFEIYLAAEKRDVSHIFDDDTEYSADEITKAMLQHGFYEFSGNVTYDYMEKDNVLVPVFQQHKKG